MNTHPQDRPTQHAQARDGRFDAAMRELHRTALANVSPQVRWKLKPAAAPQGGGGGLFGHWRRGPLLAGAGMAVLALALGVGLWPRDRQTVPAVAADAAGAGPAATAADDAFVLGQDPDFYAWLASDDAALVAME
jgi:hypothetical protein